MHLLSTLRTSCYRDARKTRCWPVCSTLTRPDFHRQADTSFPNAPRTRLPDIRSPSGMRSPDLCRSAETIDPQSLQPRPGMALPVAAAASVLGAVKDGQALGDGCVAADDQ